MNLKFIDVIGVSVAALITVAGLVILIILVWLSIADDINTKKEREMLEFNRRHPPPRW